MGFLKKDKNGRIKRIEHRGDSIRVSRTGGIALRKQIKAKGVNVSLNSAHGLRVSKRIAKGTNLGFQNNRFFIKGRYGKGATKLNLSKTGMSVSTANRFGSFNWIKPNKSSFKLAGIHIRGKEAANYQLIYGFFLVTLFLFRTLTRAFVYLATSAYKLITLPFRITLSVISHIRNRYILSRILKRYNIKTTGDAAAAIYALHLLLLDEKTDSSITSLSKKIDSILDSDSIDVFRRSLACAEPSDPCKIKKDYIVLSIIYFKNTSPNELLDLLLDVDDFFVTSFDRSANQEIAINDSLIACGINIEIKR
ncbi:MAG: hypothetical protein IBX55_21145 [Methyloprofundus sp.]|nr:hypothetical protein [Methyloprofundus sp.]